MKKDSYYVIGLAGPSASGKTYVSSYISSLYPDDVLIISLDSYCHDFHGETDDFSKINYDEPKSYDGDLLAEHIKELKEGKTIDCPIYNFSTHAREKETKKISPKPIIIIEGILLYCYPSLNDVVDYKVFIDAEREKRYIRRLNRDQKERGRTPESVLKQWNEFVVPMEIMHILPSKKHADMVIDTSTNENTYINEQPLVDYIKKIIND